MPQRTAPQRLNPLSTSELRDLLENIYRHSVKYNIAISDDDSLLVYDTVNNLFYKCTAKELVESVTPIKELIDNLESTNGTTAALSANQGRILSEWIIKNQDDLTEVIATLDSDLRDLIRDTATTLNDAIVENIATVNETIVDVDSRAQDGISGNIYAIQSIGADMARINSNVIAIDNTVRQHTAVLDMQDSRMDNYDRSISSIVYTAEVLDSRVTSIENSSDEIRDIAMATNNGSNDTDTAIVSYSNGRFKLNTPSTITPVIQPIIINDAPVTITLDGAFRLSPNDTVDILLSILTDVSSAVLTCETYIETILSSGNILISDKHTTRHVFGEASIPDTLLLRRKCNSKASGAYGRQYIYIAFTSTVPITFNIISTLAIPSKVSVNSNLTLANNIYDSYNSLIEPDVNYRLRNQHDINADLRTAINDIAGGISAEGVVKYDDFKAPDNTVYYCVESARSGMNTYVIMNTTGTAHVANISANTDGSITIRNHYKAGVGTISNLSGMYLRMCIDIPEGDYTYVARTVANHEIVEGGDTISTMLGMANGGFTHFPVDDDTTMLFHIPLNDDDSKLTHQISYTGIELEVTLRIYGVTPNAYTPFTILCSDKDSINIGFAKLKHITPANQVYDSIEGVAVSQANINKHFKYAIANIQPAEGGIKYTDYAESINDVYYATGYSFEENTHIFELATSGDALDMTILIDSNKAIQFSTYGLGGGRISNMNIPTLNMCLADLGDGDYIYSSNSSLEYQPTAGADPITIPNFYSSLGVISHLVSSEDTGLVANIPLHNDKTKYIPAITYHEYILTTKLTITHPNKPIRYNIIVGGRQPRPLRVGWTAMDGISSASQVYDHFLESYIPQSNINRYFQDNLTNMQSEDYLNSAFNSVGNDAFLSKSISAYTGVTNNGNLLRMDMHNSANGNGSDWNFPKPIPMGTYRFEMVIIAPSYDDQKTMYDIWVNCKDYHMRKVHTFLWNMDQTIRCVFHTNQPIDYLCIKSRETEYDPSTGDGGDGGHMILIDNISSIQLGKWGGDWEDCRNFNKDVCKQRDYPMDVVTANSRMIDSNYNKLRPLLYKYAKQNGTVDLDIVNDKYYLALFDYILYPAGKVIIAGDVMGVAYIDHGRDIIMSYDISLFTRNQGGYRLELPAYGATDLVNAPTYKAFIWAAIIG